MKRRTGIAQMACSRQGREPTRGERRRTDPKMIRSLCSRAERTNDVLVVGHAHVANGQRSYLVQIVFGNDVWNVGNSAPELKKRQSCSQTFDVSKQKVPAGMQTKYSMPPHAFFSFPQVLQMAPTMP